MKIRLTRHCQDMVQYRGLNIDHIKTAISKPDHKEEAFEGKMKVRKVTDGKLIEVVYYKEVFKDKREEYTVVTAYYPD